MDNRSDVHVVGILGCFLLFGWPMPRAEANDQYSRYTLPFKSLGSVRMHLFDQKYRKHSNIVKYD